MLRERACDFATRSVELVFLVFSFQHFSSCVNFVLLCISSLDLPSLLKVCRGIMSIQNRKTESFLILYSKCGYSSYHRGEKRFCFVWEISWLAGKWCNLGWKGPSSTRYSLWLSPRTSPLYKDLRSWGSCSTKTWGAGFVSSTLVSLFEYLEESCRCSPEICHSFLVSVW